MTEKPSTREPAADQARVRARLTEAEDDPSVTRCVTRSGSADPRGVPAHGLDDAETRWRLLFEQSPDGIVIIEPETARILEFNETAHRQLGYSREEFARLTISDIEDVETPGETAARIARVSREGRNDFETRHRTRQGEIRNISVTAQSTSHLGRSVYHCVWRDITDRRRAEEHVRRLATAVEQAAETIAITDASATILYVNPAFERTSGYTREEAIGQNPRILQSGRHDAEFYRVMWAALTAGQVWQGHIINKRKDGRLYEEDVSISPVRDAAGGNINYVAVKRDVTREAELEHQLRQALKMETVGRLAGGVAHDFNNLLTVINGVADLALTSLETGDPLRADLQDIRRAGEQGASLTRQLLAFSRKQIMTLEPLDLGALVAGLRDMIQRLIGESITLVVMPAKTAGSVMADPAQLGQVVMNLAVNARDAMLDGGTLTIETRDVELDEVPSEEHPSGRRGPHVMLAIRDTGAGMDEATRERVFEPFFTTKELGKGTGLGLSTVYGIVAQSGGRIDVDSEPGKGSTFRVYLPRIEEVAARVQPATLPSPPGKETILVVEDEPGVRRLAERILQMAGYTVLKVGSGEEALSLLERHDGTVDLVLTDVVLPGIGGRDLVARLLVMRPGVKVLYTSGYTDDSILRHGVLDKDVHFIGKPYGVTALTRKVREVLDLPTSP